MRHRADARLQIPLGTSAAADSPPVQLGAATTNDANLTAWILAARTANANLNVTPTNQLVNTLLTALATAAAAASGYYIRNHAAKGEVALALAVPSSTSVTTSPTGTTTETTVKKS